MRTIKIKSTYFALIILAFLFAGVSAQTRPYQVSDNQIQILLDRINSRTVDFKIAVDRSLDNSRIDGTVREDSINTLVGNFETAASNLRDNFDSWRSTTADVQDVLDQGRQVNNYILNNRNKRLSTRAENQWTRIRTDLDTLGGYYRIRSNWNNTGNTRFPSDTRFPDDRRSGFDSRITGTYRLNASRSDDVTSAVDRAINASYNSNSRDRLRRNLERRLLSPDTLSIQKSGRQVTLSSANAPSVVLNADGIARTETSANGRTVKTTITSTGNSVRINYEGDRMNDYLVTFESIARDQLRVTRRVYLENQNQTVTVNSIYDKTSSTPDWNMAGNPSYPTNTGNAGGYVIPNNTSIIATLDSTLSTRTQDGDRFTMTVTSPSRYQGAVIEGRAYGQRSGTVSGRANLSLSFETIRMRDGRTYSFAGIVDEVRQPNGDVVSVNNEGTVRDSSQTTKTVTRAGIGALLGAVIGAIAGGGSGAAIGAGVGAGAGAGSVIIQGRDNLELNDGTQFTITATAPASVATN
ncbi:MAG: hypothetical protein ACKVRN_06490 [Pyrinomonadaceae bacterium]